MPRKLEFEELLRVLVVEHGEMKDGLSMVKSLAETGDFIGASAAIKRVLATFRRHIEDEESSILRQLISSYGIPGASEEIKVFQQHRPIYGLMQKLEGLASLSPKELEGCETEVLSLLRQHTEAEEGRVFPKALEGYRSGSSK